MYWLVPVIPVEPGTPEFGPAVQAAADDLVEQVSHNACLRAAVMLAAERLGGEKGTE